MCVCVCACSSVHIYTHNTELLKLDYMKVILGQVTHCYGEGENSDELMQVPGGDSLSTLLMLQWRCVLISIVPAFIVPGNRLSEHRDQARLPYQTL